MKVGFRTVMRTFSALVIVFVLVAGASLDAWAQGRGRGRGRDNGRHNGWTRGRHRGWEHSRSRHVRNNNWWDDDRDGRRHRRDSRRFRRTSRADLNGDGFISAYERRVLASRLRRGY